MANEIVFTQPATTVRRWNDLRSRRVAMITSDPNLVSEPDNMKIILDLIPRAALDESYSIDVALLERPLWALFGGGSWRYNFEGRIAYSSTPEGIDSYVQVFHSGIIEAVKIFPRRNQIGSASIERNLIEATDSYLKAQQKLEVSPPVAILLALTGVRGCELVPGERFYSLDRYPFDRDELFIPPVILESFPDNVGTAMRPVFDRIWQAAGVPRCMHYGDDGEWVNTI